MRSFEEYGRGLMFVIVIGLLMFMISSNQSNSTKDINLNPLLNVVSLAKEFAQK